MGRERHFCTSPSFALSESSACHVLVPLQQDTKEQICSPLMQIPFWANLGANRFWTFMSVLTLRQSGVHMFCQDGSDSKPPLMVSGCTGKHATAMQQPHRAQD